MRNIGVYPFTKNVPFNAKVLRKERKVYVVFCGNGMDEHRPLCGAEVKKRLLKTRRQRWKIMMSRITLTVMDSSSDPPNGGYSYGQSRRSKWRIQRRDKRQFPNSSFNYGE